MGKILLTLRRRALVLASSALLLILLLVTSLDAARELARWKTQEGKIREQASMAGLNAASNMIQPAFDRLRTLQILTSLAWRYEIEGDAARASDLRDHLRQAVTETGSELLQFAIIDRDGILTWSTVQGFTNIDLSDREHYRVHAQGRTTPFVSEPLIGRASGRRSVQITAPFFSSGGVFNGLVVASINPERLSSELNEIAGISGDYITLLRDDGMVVARSRGQPRSIGGTISAESLAHFRASPSGRVDIKDSITQRRVLALWEAVPRLPLILIYEQDAESIVESRAEYLRMLIMKVMVTNALALGITALFGLALVYRRTRREAEQDGVARRALTEMVEALPAAVYRLTLERDGSVRSVNTSVRFAFSSQNAPIHTASGDWAGRMSPEDQQARSAMLRDVAGGGERMMEYELRQETGERHWVRDQAALLRTAPDGSSEVVGLVLDITAEREAAERLRHADRLASLGTLATSMAHEMTQPASSITLAADLALNDLRVLGRTDEAKLAARLEGICDDAMRMRDLIDLFRIFGGSDQQALAGTYIDFAAVVDGARRLTEGAMEAAGVTLEVRLPSPCARVYGQQIALQQVLVNLLLNATHVLAGQPREARTVTLSVSSVESASENWLKIIVRDSGPGFSAMALQRWSEPFFTTKPAALGTGIGLSIANGIVTRFGGTMTVRNNGGAEIEITLSASPFPLPRVKEHVNGV